LSIAPIVQDLCQYKNGPGRTAITYWLFVAYKFTK
jgi:hypothetical protein